MERDSFKLGLNAATVVGVIEGEHLSEGAYTLLLMALTLTLVIALTLNLTQNLTLTLTLTLDIALTQTLTPMACYVIQVRCGAVYPTPTHVPVIRQGDDADTDRTTPVICNVQIYPKKSQETTDEAGVDQ